MNEAIKKILDNPLTKSLLFKQLVKTMKDNNIELIALSLDNDGKLKVDAYDIPTKILPRKDFDNLILNTLEHGTTKPD